MDNKLKGATLFMRRDARAGAYDASHLAILLADGSVKTYHSTSQEAVVEYMDMVKELAGGPIQNVLKLHDNVNRGTILKLTLPDTLTPVLSTDGGPAFTTAHLTQAQWDHAILFGGGSGWCIDPPVYNFEQATPVAKQAEMLTNVRAQLAASPYPLVVTALERRHLVYVSDGNFKHQAGYIGGYRHDAGPVVDRITGELLSHKKGTVRRLATKEEVDEGYKVHKICQMKGECNCPFKWVQHMSPLLWLGPAWVLRLVAKGLPVQEQYKKDSVLGPGYSNFLFDGCRIYLDDNGEFICSDWCQRENMASKAHGISLQVKQYDLLGWVLRSGINRFIENVGAHRVSGLGRRVVDVRAARVASMQSHPTVKQWTSSAGLEVVLSTHRTLRPFVRNVRSLVFEARHGHREALKAFWNSDWLLPVLPKKHWFRRVQMGYWQSTAIKTYLKDLGLMPPKGAVSFTSFVQGINTGLKDGHLKMYLYLQPSAYNMGVIYMVRSVGKAKTLTSPEELNEVYTEVLTDLQTKAPFRYVKPDYAGLRQLRVKGQAPNAGMAKEVLPATLPTDLTLEQAKELLMQVKAANAIDKMVKDGVVLPPKPDVAETSLGATSPLANLVEKMIAKAVDTDDDYLPEEPAEALMGSYEGDMEEESEDHDDEDYDPESLVEAQDGQYLDSDEFDEINKDLAKLKQQQVPMPQGMPGEQVSMSVDQQMQIYYKSGFSYSSSEYKWAQDAWQKGGIHGASTHLPPPEQPKEDK